MIDNFTILSAGYCTAPEHILQRGGSHRHVRMPAMFALLQHPQHGNILFDTGYSHRYFTATAHYPEKLYANITPVTLTDADEAKTQLAQRGIAPEDVHHILISHFHADHIGALRDFPKAKFHYLPHAYAAVKGKRGLSALRRAFLPDLLPPDFEARGAPVPMDKPRSLSPDQSPFKQGIDLFGDESVMAVELPGHAVGQMGIFVRTDTDTYFLAADACWQSIAYREYKLPHPIAYLLFPHPRLYNLTLRHLHQLHLHSPHYHIIPSHCEEAEAHYGTK